MTNKISPDQLIVALNGTELIIDQNKKCDTCPKCLECGVAESIDCMIVECPISEEADFILSDIASGKKHRHSAIGETLKYCIQSGNLCKIDNKFNVFCKGTDCRECWARYNDFLKNRNVNNNSK